MRTSIVAATAAFHMIGATQIRADGMARTEPKPFNVTLRVFDPTKSAESGHDSVLPVDSPDAEHAIASTTATAASFTRKAEGGKSFPVAFTCIKVEAR